MHQWADRLAALARLLLCSAPLFVMTIQGWSSTMLFAASLASVAVLAWGKLRQASLAPADRRHLRVLVIVLLAPLAAAVLAALLRRDAYLPQFDSAARFWLGIPVLLLAIRLRLDAASTLKWVLPLALAFALLHHAVFGQPERWPADRMTASFVDPLVFGYLSLTFALMCLVSISPQDWEPGKRWGVVFRVAGVVLGLYLSVRSGTRTGWAAVPLVVGIWFHLRWGRTHRWAPLAALAFAILAPVLAYCLFDNVQARVDEAVAQVTQYSWKGVAPENSVALRITFLRIAADLFMQHPWAGVGDTAHAAPAALNAFSYASRSATEVAFRWAFHNQIASSGVRAGLGGLLASAALLLFPIYVCARRLGSTWPRIRSNAEMGLAFFITLFVSSMSTEVVDLKYMASFYAVMTAILCGSVLAAGARPR
jgi:O-antigen ligase